MGPGLENGLGDGGSVRGGQVRRKPSVSRDSWLFLLVYRGDETFKKSQRSSNCFQCVPGDSRPGTGTEDVLSARNGSEGGRKV